MLESRIHKEAGLDIITTLYDLREKQTYNIITNKLKHRDANS